MIENKNSPGTAYRQGLKETNRISTLKQNGDYCNPYVSSIEKLRLIKMFVYGLRYMPDEFTDHRHKILAANVETFLQQFPLDQHTAHIFVLYLTEISAIDICGGRDYVAGLFKGIGG
jgi:hypothetical protein